MACEGVGDGAVGVEDVGGVGLDAALECEFEFVAFDSGDGVGGEAFGHVVEGYVEWGDEGAVFVVDADGQGVWLGWGEGEVAEGGGGVIVGVALLVAACDGVAVAAVVGGVEVPDVVLGG